MLSSDLSPLRSLLLALGLALGSATMFTPITAGIAFAQEEDDDNDEDDDDIDEDDDDDDGDGWSGGDDDDDDGGSLWFGDDDDDLTPIFAAPARPAAPAPPPAPLPEQADDQVVLEDLNDVGRQALVELGFAVLEQAGPRALLRVPDDLEVTEALQLIAATAPTALAAPNSFYRNQAAPSTCSGAAICNHWQAVDWPPLDASEQCEFAPYIGIIDTGVNEKHDMLAQANLTVEGLSIAGAEPSGEKHGTAVVAMFVGEPDGRVPGLAPAARLHVVDPFGTVGTDERSDVFALASALDRLLEIGVDVASLSLAGPDNPILGSAVEALQSAGIPVVAAVGNAGAHAEPMYPAAYPDVLAVTAVDGAGNIYRRAVQGDHVGFAAPGVAIPTAASISGIRPQTGTSFAVPFVTTAVAAAMAGGQTTEAAITALAEASEDLGAQGKDPVFGWGLTKIPSPC